MMRREGAAPEEGPVPSMREFTILRSRGSRDSMGCGDGGVSGGGWETGESAMGVEGVGSGAVEEGGGESKEPGDGMVPDGVALQDSKFEAGRLARL